MIHHELAELFDNMADLLEFRNENPFRVRAYRRASAQLAQLSEDVRTLDAENRLTEIPGIGQDLARKIHEYLATGTVVEIERLKQQVPPSIFLLIQVPGIGPKTAAIIAERLKITSLAQLEAAAHDHQLCKLPGIQEVKEQKILKGLALVRQGQHRRTLGAALSLAQRLIEQLKALPDIRRIEIAGSLRRMKETIGDVDVLVSTAKPAAVMRQFTGGAWCRQVLASGPTKTSILTTDGMQVDLRAVKPEEFGAAWVYLTGSKDHNVRLRERAIRLGLKLNEYGLFRAASGRRVAGREEADVYKALGLDWIPPEIREDSGELDAAADHTLPRLIEAKDIRGDFHVHTNQSDGSNTLQELADAARRRGYEYLAITDHSQSLKIAHGLSEAAMTAQLARIAEANSTLRGLTLLSGAEVDILKDGRMDYPDRILKQLDVVIGSVHSGFNQPEATITNRILSAMRNRYVTFIAHPTGRLHGQREPYAVNLPAVFEGARETQTALEINASPTRLDLEASAARQAVAAGARIVLSTDTHRLDHLDHMTLGLGLARRAWLEPKDVLNCLRRDELLAWIQQKRNRP